ncbi:MAG: cytochrome P450 [Rhodospirillaceae bacterium]|nr:cytochrome P450 [Rhodospirillaceae bacterium]
MTSGDMASESGAPFLDPTTLADPYPFYAAHRGDGPVVAVNNGARETYLVTGYAAVRDVLASPEIFSSKPEGAPSINFYPSAEALLKEKGFGRTPLIIAMDPPRHTAHRAVTAKLLRDKRVHKMRGEIRRVAESLIAEFQAAGRCEFVRDYAWRLSVLVIADLLGVDRDRIDDFKRWSDAWVRPLITPLTEAEMLDCIGQMAELQHFLVGEIEARKTAPRDDLLSDIAHATIDLGAGEMPLRQHEQLGICEALMIAGNDSTANALSLGMLRLVEFPEVAARIRGDMKLVEQFAEESLRYEAAVQSNFRTVKEDTEFHGVAMKKGALVFVSWGAANRDADTFANPEHFDINRTALKTHLGFGGGTHSCAGAALARQELAESYDLLLRRLANIRLQPGWTVSDIKRTGGIVTHGLAMLPLQFEPLALAADEQSANAAE